MTTRRPSGRILFAKVLGLAVAGCSAAGGNEHSNGGSNAAGSLPSAAGFTGSGGAIAGGGSVAAGGSVATGGSTGAAGQEASGVGIAGGTSGASGAGGSSAGPTGGATNVAGAAAAGAAGNGAQAGAPAQCVGSQSAPKAGDATVGVQSGGRSRSFILHVPSGLAPGAPLALIIDLHGAGGSGKQQQALSGFNALADKEKFLAIFPNGIDGYWNVDDTCCGTAGKEKVDDVGFLKTIISKLSAELCIDSKRIYVSGFSNGGGLAHRMGCDAADVVAAIAPTATDLRTQPCTVARPISMMEVKGMVDSLEPYDGGLVGPVGGQYVAVGAKASQKLWADIDKCSGSAATSDKYCTSYSQCADGVEVDLCSLPNTGHDVYGNTLGFDVAGVAWSMFKRQAMK